jgi:hypothetical protein
MQAAILLNNPLNLPENRFSIDCFTLNKKPKQPRIVEIPPKWQLQQFFIYAFYN